jgi:diguanylate cyclase (GGDEF)-like protein/PAS domain S-box-containing protein
MTPSQEQPPLDILIIEDEPRYLESTRLLLAHYRHRVDVAATGTQAFERLAKRAYQVVLLDLRLPDASGLDILKHLSREQPTTLVIVMSGDASLESPISALRLGAYDYLHKPYEPEELIKTIRNAGQEIGLRASNLHMREQLAQSEQWHRFLVNNSPDIIFTLDGSGCFSYLNNSAERLLGYSKAELLGQPWQMLMHVNDLETAHYHMNDRRSGERATRNLELRFRRRATGDLPEEDTAFITVELNASGIYQQQEGQSRQFQGTYGVARDISDRKRAEATITFQAYHDLLTGLPNRALFKDRLTQAMANARRHGLFLATMFLDLDRFKTINDTLGHLVGDELLQAVSYRLRGCLREGDTLARIGGDEFMLLLPHIRSRDNASHIAEKILAALKAPFHIDQHELFISASIGISVFPEDGDTLEVLVKHADIAMYAAKDLGRNDYRFYDPEQNLSLDGRLAVENDLRRALQRNEFEVYYQPQVDVMSGLIIGMEALVRWRHPKRGMVTPGEFIPIAEESGLIAPISEWVLQSAFQQASHWRQMALPNGSLAINLSARQIEHPHFVEHFHDVMRANNLAGGQLDIEITESTLMRDMEGSIHKLKQLSVLGVEISIDDFGTGYSSLSYLKKLPVHTLKIDRSFVHDLSTQSNGSSIVAGIAAMAKGLRLNLVAEGVETEDQLAYLRDVGCNAYQGYLYSQPLCAEDATDMLRRQPLH